MAPAIVAANRAVGVPCLLGDALHPAMLRRFLACDVVFFGPPLSAGCDGHHALAFGEILALLAACLPILRRPLTRRCGCRWSSKMAETGPLAFVEIERLDDALLLPWLDLYETAFPPAEKVLVSWFLRFLKERQCGPERDCHLAAVVDEAGRLAGMAMYQVLRGPAAGILWYIAVQPAQRNRGIGAWAYGEIVRRTQAAGCGALLLEVEIPEDAGTDAARDLAQRRIEFYRRQGARLLRGVRYRQYVGWHQPPLPMHVMVHPFRSLDAIAAFELAAAAFGEWIAQVGTLALE